MKNVLRILVFAAMVVTFALPAVAQDAAAADSGMSAQEIEAKNKLYTDFLDLRKKTDPASQKQAYEKAKEYLAKYGNATNEDDRKIVDYIKNWAEKYEKAVLNFEFAEAVAKNPAGAFQMADRVMAVNPDKQLETHLRLVQAGLVSVQKSDTSLYSKTNHHARQALQMIEQGKTAQEWTPWTNRDEAIGALNYTIGFTYLGEKNPDAAVSHLIKAAQASAAATAKEPTTYQFLASAYIDGEFKRLAADYKQRCEGQEATPECDALFARVNNVLDRAIDAYARAAALQKDQAKRKDVMNSLTALYKSRHSESTEAQLQEYINNVMSRPLPKPGDPVTPSTAEASVTPSTSSQPAATPTPNANSTPNAAKPAAETNKPATNATPASTTKPVTKTTAPAKKTARGKASGR